MTAGRENPNREQRSDAEAEFERTPLYDLHVALGAKMVAFAGYAMPVSYPLGVMQEHLHARNKAGLFDVSHMGQAFLVGPDHETSSTALEALVPGSIVGLGPGRIRYTLLLNQDGGIVDDLMVTRSSSSDDDGRLYLVVNASRKDVDYALLAESLPSDVVLQQVSDRALMALQGPRADAIMRQHCPKAGGLGFMAATSAEFDGIDCHVSRSGYTGEDGFELSIPSKHAERVARTLLDHDDVEAIGLGARDSLRLEAGFCLYGHDLDETTSPIEAALGWTIAKRRRTEGGFPGAERILRELSDGPARVRVGIAPEGRAPAREGTEIVDADGRAIGVVTSGGFGPSVSAPVAMGYVDTAMSEVGTKVGLMVRGKQLPGRVAKLPFVPHRYRR